MLVLLRTCCVALAAAALAAAASAATIPGLRSPSGNISCVATPAPHATLVCSIKHAAYAAALQNRCLNPHGEMGAGVDWHGWTLPAAGKGAVNCSGGILYVQTPRYRTVAYGTSWRAGPFTCSSAVTGVTCRNRAGHGLFVSRESWRAW